MIDENQFNLKEDIFVISTSQVENNIKINQIKELVSNTDDLINIIIELNQTIEYLDRSNYDLNEDIGYRVNTLLRILRD